MRLLLFIIYPFLTFIDTLRQFKGPIAKFIFIAFYALFGYCQTFELKTADIYRIGLWFQQLSDSNILALYSSGSRTDIYMWLIMAAVKQFTNNPKVCIAVFGGIYGLLSYYCLKPVYTLYKGKKNLPFYCLVLVALSNISLVHLTGIRFYTAVAFFVAVMLKVLISGKGSYIFLTLLAPLIHFGFFPIVALNFIYYYLLRHIFSNKIALLRVMVVVSLILSFLPLKNVSSTIISETEIIENAAIQSKFQAYSSERDGKKSLAEDAGTAYREANNAFTKTFEVIKRIGLCCLIFIILGKSSSLQLTEVEKRMMIFFAIFGCFALIAVALMGSGGRMLSIPWAVMLPFVASVYMKNVRLCSSISKQLVLYNFYSVAFLFFNSPRLVTPLFWISNLPSLIWDGFNFRIPLMVW